jgi:hypothetical protein
MRLQCRRNINSHRLSDDQWGTSCCTDCRTVCEYGSEGNGLQHFTE